MIGLAMLAAATASAMPVPAAASVCSTLQAELATLPRAASRDRLQSYERAIARQEAALAQARTNLRRAGCQGLFASGRIQCPPLRGTIARMTENLDKLRGERAAMGDASTHRQRLELTAALKRNACGASGSKTVNGTHPSTPAASSAKAGEGNAVPRGFKAGGSFRTMCVRLCDGYYFPISYSVPASRFPDDAKACEARCPGSETALYTHRVPEEESADMVSAATGRPYRDLDTAFAHRSPSRRKGEACSCRTAEPEAGPKGFSVIAGENRNESDRTNDNASSILSLDHSDLRPQLATAIGNAREKSLDEKRPVRVVGPKFLPDPEEAIDLRAPVPTPGP